jgi:hypothetical protein
MSESEEERPVLFSFGGVDGGPRVEISVSEDSMVAWGTFYPASSPDGKLLVWSDFADALQAANLASHLLDRTIQDVLFQFNTSHPAPAQVVIARGQAPKAERPAFLKLEPRFYEHHFHDSGEVQVDFKEFSPFVIVKKGELLARAVLPREGVPGETVFGNPIPAGRKDIKHLKPGPHTLFAHGKVFSRIAGRFTLEGDVFDVADTLELDAGVGYGTGNLVFPGSVIIKGVVGAGFKVAAGEGITVKGPLDASEVLCHGDLVCEGGIIGRKPGMVRVGRTIKALYLEHCQVEALGTIHIAKALLHTRVYTNANLELDDGGRIVSSTVWVRGVLTCAQLGGENGHVKVVAGSDFVIQRKMDAIRHRYHVLEEEVQKLKTHGQEPSSDQVAALGALVAEMNTLSPLLFSNPAAEVRVTSKVFEGTVLEMGFATLTVTKPLKGQVFKLSSDGKTIVAAPFSKDSAPAAE